MQLLESLKIGAYELRSHKLRSFLTMLGVIFGVAAVVAVVAIGLGAQEEALRQIQLLGTNNIRVRRTRVEGFELAALRRKSPEGLTRGDARALERIVPGVEVAICRRDSSRPPERDFLRVYHEGQSPPSVIAAVEPEYLRIMGARVTRGRFLSDSDDKHAHPVCVLGSSIAEALFPLEEPLGNDIRIGPLLYRVVGVMGRRAQSGSEGSGSSNPNLEVYVSLEGAFLRFAQPGNPEDLNEITLILNPDVDLRETGALVERVLMRRHHDARDFEIVIPELLLEQKQATQRIFSYFLIFIAGISLLVGGIGIMNIMLATVTQRTREIGVRRAIGATRNDILVQFLIEALLICLLGGLVGLAMGVGLSRLAQQIAGWPTVISVPAMIVAIGVASGTGIVFGLYPSLKAARLDPIEALRHE